MGHKITGDPNVPACRVSFVANLQACSPRLCKSLCPSCVHIPALHLVLQVSRFLAHHEPPFFL